jgi:ABC-2 type transport system permease protein
MMENALASPIGIFARESVAELRKSLRLPQFMLPTVITPAVFYGLFAIALNKSGPAAAAYSLATFGVFAATGPALFGFGAGVAVERDSGLIELKRVSPLPAGAFVGAKLVSAGAMAAIALALIYALALVGGVRLPAQGWASLIAIHLLAVVPFALIGFAIGMRLNAKGAIAAANALYLGFSIVGGLWMPIYILPHWMQQLAWVTPSFHLGQLGLATIGMPSQGSAIAHIAALGLISLFAAWLAVSGWRRSPA